MNEPRPQDFWFQLRNDRLALVSALGSLASIVALGIVLVEKVTADSNLGQQLAVWRIIFFSISVVATAGAILFTYLWVRDAIASTMLRAYRKTLSVTLRICIGLLLVGVCLDAVYAALYWDTWLRSLIVFLRGLI